MFKTNSATAAHEPAAASNNQAMEDDALNMVSPFAQPPCLAMFQPRNTFSYHFTTLLRPLFLSAPLPFTNPLPPNLSGIDHGLPTNIKKPQPHPITQSGPARQTEPMGRFLA